MAFAFDCDGTIYDSKHAIFSITNLAMAKFGYEAKNFEELMKHYQSKDWRKYYHDLGVKDDHIDAVITEYVQKFETAPKSNLIEGARELLRSASLSKRPELFFIVTNALRPVIEMRFRRDSLDEFIPNIKSAFQGKYLLLSEIMQSLPNNEPMYFLSDTICDGEDCLKLKKLGFNIHFWAIAHSYSFNTAHDLKAFVDAHKEFCKIFNDLYEVTKELAQRITLRNRKI
ncbi:MAG: HAD hydrolase-like protein [Candidatus Woesearchaeota archaeon]